MVRLFSQLCKYFKKISNEDEINTFNIQIKSIDVAKLTCPNCDAKLALSYFGSYERHLVTYEHNTYNDSLLNIPRYICSSCGHTHAILPAIIIPYMSFSFNFVISLIHDYLVNRFHSIEALCLHFCVSISTFYRILSKFKEHKKLWLGLLDDALKSPLCFIQEILSWDLLVLGNFIISFFNKISISFFQGKS